MEQEAKDATLRPLLAPSKPTLGLRELDGAADPCRGSAEVCALVDAKRPPTSSSIWEAIHVTVQEMLQTHPAAAADVQTLVRCIEDCFACAESCTACADACLAEDQVGDLRRCIRINLDCADICIATGNVLTRQTEPETSVIRTLLEACAAACRACGEECERHAEHHEHCRICADACRSCEQACEDALSSLPA